MAAVAAWPLRRRHCPFSGGRSHGAGCLEDAHCSWETNGIQGMTTLRGVAMNACGSISGGQCRGEVFLWAMTRTGLWHTAHDGQRTWHRTIRHQGKADTSQLTLDAGRAAGANVSWQPLDCSHRE